MQKSAGTPDNGKRKDACGDFCGGIILFITGKPVDIKTKRRLFNEQNSDYLLERNGKH